MKLIAYSLLGLLLIPAALILSRTCAMLLRHWWCDCALGPQSILMLAGGFNLWILILMLLPAPMRAYVLAHEMTHALWGVTMGARLSAMRISRSGGYVKLSEHNFLVALAPYFFPFYTVLILLAYWIYSWFFAIFHARWAWLLLIGASLGFHCTFTLRALARGQSDLRDYGFIFSGLLIHMGNVGVLILLTALLAGMPAAFLGEQLALDARTVWLSLCMAAAWIRQHLQ